jgi:hypothetical protein
MPARGKLAVLLILLVAAAMAGGAWWWNYHRGRRCLALYGSEAAYLIRTAPLVELIDAETGKTTDISRAAGLVHARTALLDDASYEWEATATAQGDEFHAVRFTRGARHVTLRFSARDNSLFVGESGRGAMFDQKTADGWRAFIERQMAGGKP